MAVPITIPTDMDMFIYTPLYNLMVALIDLVPSLDLGLYIILFTIIVKIILLPLALRAVKAQQAIKAIEPKVKELQEKYKDNRQELGVKLMALYKENQVNPFASFGLILVQIPIIFGLYYIVLRSGLPEIDPAKLYSFIPVPSYEPSPLLLSMIDVTAKSLPLALIAGITQYIQTKIALPANNSDKAATPQQQMMQTMMKQMQYVFPILIAVIAYILSAAVGLYFITSNLFHIGQELYVRRQGIRDQSSVAFDI